MRLLARSSLRDRMSAIVTSGKRSRASILRDPTLPQIERKEALLDLLGESDTPYPVLFSEHLIGDGQQMFEHAAS
jgi:hypothetical protein